MDEEKKEKGNPEAGAQAQEEEAIPADMLPPPVDFGLHCESLRMQAWIHMGKIAHPGTGETMRNLTWAKFFIDTLGMLQTKTQGNLTDDEKRYLDMTLTTLRLTYVEEQKAQG